MDIHIYINLPPTTYRIHEDTNPNTNPDLIRVDANGREHGNGWTCKNGSPCYVVVMMNGAVIQVFVRSLRRFRSTRYVAREMIATPKPAE